MTAAAARRGPDRRLLPPAVVAWGAAWWGTGGSGPDVVWAAAGAALLAGVLALVVVRWPPVALAAAAAAAVLAACAGAVTVRAAGPWPGWVADRAAVQLEGTVVSDAARVVDPAPARPGAAPRWTLRVDVERATARGRTQLLGLPVLVVADAAWREVSAGQHVRLAGRAAPPRPGDETVALVVAAGAPRALEQGSWPWRLADTLRASLRQACAGLPARAGGLLPSLVDGDTSTLPDALRAELSAAGLSHLTAVSGANLAIMVESALWVAAALRWPRWVRLPLLVVTLVGFVVLARPSPSVLRAAGMGAVAVAAAASARRPRGVPALAAAVVVLLAADPWLARSAGFVLSVVATAALLLLAPVWATALARYLPRPAALALAAPAAAQVACGPVVILLQPAVSVVAVPANLLAEPAVAPATVVGVLAALAGPLSPSVAHALAVAGGFSTGWIALVAAVAARLPLASVPWPGGLPGAVLLVGVEAVAVAATVPAGRRAFAAVLPAALSRRPAAVPRRAVVALGLAAALATAAWWSGLRPPLPGHGPPPTGWEVAMCDVGQGDATVLRSGDDRAVLVDAGPDPALVDGCLHRLGIRHLDLVVLTHFHADHVGGLTGALDGRDAGAVLVSPLGRPPANAAAVLHEAASDHLTVTVARPGQAGVAGAGRWSLRWRVVAASAEAGAGEPDADGTVVNEASVALDVTVDGPAGRLHVVLLGDLETQGQQALAAALGRGEQRLAGPVDVVKVAHHGSAKQSEDLYRRIGARLGLVGVGAGNDYGHPARSALDLLARTGTRVLRTDLGGDLVVAPGADGALSVTTTR